MSAYKQKIITRDIAVSTTWSANVLTVNTFNSAGVFSHFLTTGDIVSLYTQNSPQELINVPVTVISATQFTVPASTNFQYFASGIVRIPTWRTGVATPFANVTIPSRDTNGSGIIQATNITGAATSTFTVSGSVDGVGFISIGSLVVPAAANGTISLLIPTYWVYYQIGITSIGAGTAVQLTHSF
jgi:hypothetical protein